MSEDFEFAMSAEDFVRRVVIVDRLRRALSVFACCLGLVALAFLLTLTGTLSVVITLAIVGLVVSQVIRIGLSESIGEKPPNEAARLTVATGATNSSEIPRTKSARAPIVRPRRHRSSGEGGRTVRAAQNGFSKDPPLKRTEQQERMDSVRGVPMPAVTVSDFSTLPRVPVPDPALTKERPVRSVTTAPSGFEGEGFPVRRAFAGMSLQELDPFVHMDQMGEVDSRPENQRGHLGTLTAGSRRSPT